MKSSSLLKSLIREVIDVRTEYDKKVESIYDAYRRVGDLGNLELDSPVFYETVAEKIADVFKINKGDQEKMQGLKELSCLFGAQRRFFLPRNINAFFARAAVFKVLTGKSQDEIFQMTLKSLLDDTSGAKFRSMAEDAGFYRFLKHSGGNVYLFTFNSFPNSWSCN
jgi:hypothetical protein